MEHDAPQPAPAMRPAVQETYGPADLSAAQIFAGGFINFGYWPGIDLSRPLDETDRIRSQQALYRHVLDALRLPDAARLLEVGCGLGMGCALALAEYGAAAVTGLDIHPAQLRRAREAHAETLRREPDRLRFVQGAAEEIPLAEREFDAVLSVEAAQHFPDLTAFAAETFRVLRPGGRVAVTSFFTPDDSPGRPEDLAELLLTFADGLDIARPVGALANAFAAAGLTEVRTRSIGPGVWPGWDAWLSRWWDEDTWPRNFRHAWERRLLDYYVVTAGRPTDR
ncbi:class I SAM-dependent methyltransferase [Kitasatospora cheerisanensis]|uniref:Methyltransferase n=1 Tax=Kitasatospora cheerisanensis KCTC 2395 TaxID=1348663 RepID=A0A066YXD8_9ACTN|nr:class I SAM-dependent methyltransferase [Kitasatospora cheerisanensis]KDN84649.1 methyltransferase [Kitasatospora cheerisanensis KCTC 2395]